MNHQHFPFAAVFAFFFVLAMLRGQLTYWIARLVTEQTLKYAHPASGWRLRVHNWLSDGAADHGRAILNRWGLAAVPLCYLTVGVQTLVLAAAGVTRIQWWRFTLAQLPGALAWAAIYSTIGFTLWAAAWESAVRRHPWAAAGLVLLAVLIIVLVRRARRSNFLNRD